jgi:hypothetical protein
MTLEKRLRPKAPDELVFRTCYASLDLHEILASPNPGPRIRELPAAQLFFSLQELDDEDTRLILNHVSAAQWRETLDLALWKRDRMDVDRFLGWQGSVLEAAPEAVRRLLDAPDPELYELAFRRRLKIFARTEEDEFEEMPAGTGEWFDTPDKGYRILLPKDQERARLLRGLLTHLYRVNPGAVRLYLESSRARTAMEIEETAYEENRRRMDELGFQDYYRAIEIYAPLSADSPLPDKRVQPRERPVTLPARMPPAQGAPWFLVQALAHIAETEDAAPYFEELFFVCNKVLSADGVSTAEPRRVKQGIRKAMSGINLGLDCWAAGDAARAAEGVRRHYLQSFFRIGCGRLQELRGRAELRCAVQLPEPGSPDASALEGLKRRYPLYTVIIRGRVRRRFFFCRRDVERAAERWK